ncbi:hypothetical protein AB4Y86_13180 [Arthrobacter sp. 2YAF22_2]|uniref:hypothetical protein n=1 Tax=Arthrobacter sp. 2YAF22_2 TaxID=3233029 RepID=UPI003F8EEBAE
MKTPAEDRCPTVRMFPDYADTVLWFDDPVDYDLAGLTQGLVRDLRVWEQSYYESLTPDLDWKSAELARRFTVEGNRLARRVADELGDGYEIEFTSYEKNVPARRFRGTGPALNARAAAAFDGLAAARGAEQDEISRARTAEQRGENTGWFAYSPLSDTVFKPPRAGRE